MGEHTPHAVLGVELQKLVWHWAWYLHVAPFPSVPAGTQAAGRTVNASRQVCCEIACAQDVILATVTPVPGAEKESGQISWTRSMQSCRVP
jgi:hypothetical protein